MNRRRILTAAILIVITLLTVNLLIFPTFAKTLSNEDIHELEKDVNKGVPTYNPGTPQPTTPGQPENQGVPTVPPPVSAQGGQSGGTVIIKKHLPYMEWEKEYANYFKKYYNDSTIYLTPKMIALHYSGTGSFSQLWWTFVNGGMYDGEKGHLSVHFAVDTDGTIYELMPLTRRARGTYGVNHVAISIDIIGTNENMIISNTKQMDVVFSLVRWLMKSYKIPKEKVLAHEEIARGKELVPEYTDFHDKQFPTRYPPNSRTRGPGKAYMFKLRYYLVEP